jgi:quercetin dioxygenase-like cupin family protein
MLPFASRFAPILNRTAMARLPAPGTRIGNPFIDETFIFTHVDETAAICQFDVHLDKGGVTTGTGRQHLHPNADETISVQDGALRLMVDGQWQQLGPDETRTVPPGVPHLFRNGHDGETLFTAAFAPACDHLRFFLNMTQNTATHSDRYDARGEPPLLLRAQALHAYAGHAYGDGIPIWFQRTVFAALSPVAYLRGYRLAVSPRRRASRADRP